MEQSSANLIEFTIDILNSKSKSNYFDFFDEKKPSVKELNHLEFKEPYLQNQYFKKLCDYILYYNEVLLFGKSNATSQLFDILSYDNRFYKIKIAIIQTDKMKFNQQNEFVANYFLLNNL